MSRKTKFADLSFPTYGRCRDRILSTIRYARSLALHLRLVRNKMAHSYYVDHLNSNGDFEFEMAKPTRPIDFRKYGIALDWSASIFLKVRIRSRHSMSVKYFVYVLVDKNKQGIEALSAHFCSCKVGQRVVGCCSHVATIMWFFGYARFLLDINKPAHSLCDIFYNIASSESEENDEDDV